MLPSACLSAKYKEGPNIRIEVKSSKRESRYLDRVNFLPLKLVCFIYSYSTANYLQHDNMNALDNI